MLYQKSAQAILLASVDQYRKQHQFWRPKVSCLWTIVRSGNKNETSILDYQNIDKKLPDRTKLCNEGDVVENVHNKELIYINYMVQNAEILPKVHMFGIYQTQQSKQKLGTGSDVNLTLNSM